MRGCNFPRSHKKFLGLALASALISGHAVAQQGQAPAQAPQQQQSPQPTQPGQGPGQTPGRQDPGQIPGRSPFPGQRPDQQQQWPDMQQQRMFFFQGKVQLDDGTPPPDPVQIERVCNGIVQPEAWTDSKGRFSFQLGQNSRMMADASVGSSDPLFDRPGSPNSVRMPGMNQGVNERDLMGCELRASLAGFRSDVVSLAGRRSMDNPDVGTIILHRMAKVDGFTFSATSAYAPKSARKAYEKGQSQNKKKKFDVAEKSLQKAVTEYPKYAAAWYELGTVFHQQQKIAEAREAYRKSLEADAKYVNPYGPLARLEAGEKKWEEAADLTAKLIRLNPYYSPDAYFISSVANLNLNRLEQAEEHAQEALKMDKQRRNPRVLQIIAIVRAEKKDFTSAAQNLKEYLKLAPDAPDADNVRAQLGEIEKRMAAAGSGATPPPQ